MDSTDFAWLPPHAADFVSGVDLSFVEATLDRIIREGATATPSAVSPLSPLSVAVAPYGRLTAVLGKPLVMAAVQQPVAVGGQPAPPLDPVSKKPRTRLTLEIVVPFETTILSFFLPSSGGLVRLRDDFAAGKLTLDKNTNPNVIVPYLDDHLDVVVGGMSLLALTLHLVERRRSDPSTTTSVARVAIETAPGKGGVPAERAMAYDALRGEPTGLVTDMVQVIWEDLLHRVRGCVSSVALNVAETPISPDDVAARFARTRPFGGLMAALDTANNLRAWPQVSSDSSPPQTFLCDEVTFRPATDVAHNPECALSLGRKLLVDTKPDLDLAVAKARAVLYQRLAPYESSSADVLEGLMAASLRQLFGAVDVDKEIQAFMDGTTSNAFADNLKAVMDLDGPPSPLPGIDSARALLRNALDGALARTIQPPGPLSFRFPERMTSYLDDPAFLTQVVMSRLRDAGRLSDQIAVRIENAFFDLPEVLTHRHEMAPLIAEEILHIPGLETDAFILETVERYRRLILTHSVPLIPVEAPTAGVARPDGSQVLLAGSRLDDNAFDGVAPAVATLPKEAPLRPTPPPGGANSYGYVSGRFLAHFLVGGLKNVLMTLVGPPNFNKWAVFAAQAPFPMPKGPAMNGAVQLGTAFEDIDSLPLSLLPMLRDSGLVGPDGVFNQEQAGAMFGVSLSQIDTTIILHRLSLQKVRVVLHPGESPTSAPWPEDANVPVVAPRLDLIFDLDMRIDLDDLCVTPLGPGGCYGDYHIDGRVLHGGVAFRLHIAGNGQMSLLPSALETASVVLGDESSTAKLDGLLWFAENGVPALQTFFRVLVGLLTGGAGILIPLVENGELPIGGDIGGLPGNTQGLMRDLARRLLAQVIEAGGFDGEALQSAFGPSRLDWMTSLEVTPAGGLRLAGHVAVDSNTRVARTKVVLPVGPLVALDELEHRASLSAMFLTAAMKDSGSSELPEFFFLFKDRVLDLARKHGGLSAFSAGIHVVSEDKGAIGMAKSDPAGVDGARPSVRLDPLLFSKASSMLLNLARNELKARTSLWLAGVASYQYMAGKMDVHQWALSKNYGLGPIFPVALPGFGSPVPQGFDPGVLSPVNATKVYGAFESGLASPWPNFVPYSMVTQDRIVALGGTPVSGVPAVSGTDDRPTVVGRLDSERLFKLSITELGATRTPGDPPKGLPKGGSYAAIADVTLYPDPPVRRQTFTLGLTTWGKSNQPYALKVEDSGATWLVQAYETAIGIEIDVPAAELVGLAWDAWPFLRYRFYVQVKPNKWIAFQGSCAPDFGQPYSSGQLLPPPVATRQAVKSFGDLEIADRVVDVRILSKQVAAPDGGTMFVPAIQLGAQYLELIAAYNGKYPLPPLGLVGIVGKLGMKKSNFQVTVECEVWSAANPVGSAHPARGTVGFQTTMSSTIAKIQWLAGDPNAEYGTEF